MITRQQADKIAIDFTEKCNPQMKGKLKIERINSYHSSTSRDYIIRLYEGEIPVSYGQFDVSVDREYGEVSSYGNNAKLTRDTTPTLSKKDIGIERAKKAYMKELGLQLKYVSYKNYSDRKRMAYPVYSLNDARPYYAIDAETGKKIKLQEDSLEKFYIESSMGLDQDDAAFSEKEIQEMDILVSLLSKEDAIKQIASMLPTTFESAFIDAKVYKDIYEIDKYMWDILFGQKGFGEVDAKTGTLLKFWTTRDIILDMPEETTLEAAQTTAYQFAQRYIPEYLKETKLDEWALQIEMLHEFTNRYDFNYVRQVNGIDFQDNGIAISVDKDKGQVLSYELTWYDNIEFPAIDKVISKEEAFDRLCDELKFIKAYCLTEDGNSIPCYVFLGRGRERISAFNGVRVNLCGEPFVPSIAEPETYTDIEGHWAESIIITLLENGYYFSGDKFYPDEPMKQEDFFSLLFAEENKSSIKSRVIKNDILTEAEYQPEKPLTRKEAAKIIAGALGYKAVGEKTEIFNEKFNYPKDNEYRGFIAICYGFNIMKPKGDGWFHGEDILTRAEGAELIYRLLKEN